MPTFHRSIDALPSALTRRTPRGAIAGELDGGLQRVAEIGAKVKPDLILAVGIWAVQAVAKEASTVPVVYAMVLNPPSVIGSGAKNFTGASMNVPVEQTIRVLKQL